MLETFCLRLAGGLVLALLALPVRVVSPRFYRTQLLIALCLLITASVFAWHTAAQETLLWLAIGLSAGLSVVAFWLWSAEGVATGTLTLLLLTALLFTAMLALPGKMNESRGWLAPALDEFSSAAFLGAATTAMLLGHWYLIATTMSINPLLRLLLVLAVANLVRLATTSVIPVNLLANGIELDRLAWLWLSVRWLAGLLAPLGLTWMAWQSARIRSTQSATGILYVVVIFVFFGELTDLLLQDHLTTLGGGVR